MRIVVALGGNALIQTGEALSVANQRHHVQRAVQELLPIIKHNQVVITHGNGPQVGLLALQSYAYNANETTPLDVLDAQTEGMIGYIIEQELNSVLPENGQCVALLTQVEVDADDPAFKHPTKPIGPHYTSREAQSMEHQRGWNMVRDGDTYRRVVPSPQPRRIFELSAIKFLMNQGIIVICAGGGGIPIIVKHDGSLVGVEAVIDKDSASALLAKEIQADALLLLTDVDAVYQDWQHHCARAIRQIDIDSLRKMTFALGSMQPKVEAAIEFIKNMDGFVAIGSLNQSAAIINGDAGTSIKKSCETLYWH